MSETTQSDDVLDDAVALLRKIGSDAAADEVVEISRRTPPGRTVVVVGEVKRGKSSLVNTLVGHGEISPVGVDIATSAQIRFVPPSPDLPDGHAVLLYGGGRREPVELDDVRRWVSLDGEHADVTSDEEIPLGAEVAASSELLPHTTIVDTPGVNGLDPRHGKAAMAAIDGARTLLMVCDAMAPMSAAELEYLRQAGGDRGSVVVAVTKTDKALRTWKAIVDENRALLKKYAPVFADAPVVGVSSLFAQRAERTGSVAMRKGSGIDELVATLESELGDPTSVVRTDAGRRAFAALDAARVALQRKAAVLADAPEGKRKLTEQIAELKELKATQKEWQAKLSQSLTRLSLAHDHRVRTEYDALRKRWETKLGKVGALEISRRAQAIAGEIVADITALAKELAERYHGELTDLAAALLGAQLADNPDVVEALAGHESPELRTGREFTAWKGFFDPQMLTMVMAGGGSIGALGASLAGVLGAATVASGIGVAALPVWALFAMSFRVTKFGRTNMTKWLVENCRAAQEDMIAAGRKTQNDLSADLKLGYARILESAIVAAQELVKESEKQSTLSAAQRAKDRNALVAQHRDVVAMLDKLRATTLSPGAPVPRTSDR